ncbi:MAG: hypothetical protein EB015_14280 [Methylocystaceae bacterium]|nr:hypothetical protein [Methylocystaceae bacterium]
MDALTAYVHKVYEHPKIRDIYPSAFSGWSGIEVADGRRRRHGGGDIDGITMPIWARRPWVVLHEVAHVITERVFPYEGGHSQNYCGVYLNLVRIILGKEAQEALCRSFAKHGVKVREHEPFIKKKKTSKLLAFNS